MENVLETRPRKIDSCSVRHAVKCEGHSATGMLNRNITKRSSVATPFVSWFPR